MAPTLRAWQPACTPALASARPGVRACIVRAQPGACSSSDSGAESTGGGARCCAALAAAPGAPGAAATRRTLLLGAGGAALLCALGSPLTAQAGGLDKYIKKKKLDPLDTYVPLVLQAQEQLLALSGTLVSDPAGARDRLRSGAFGGLRDNVRALGEYAVASQASPDAASLVTGFFRKLEDFDLVLSRAVRNGTAPDGADAEAKLAAATAALAALLATVPGDVLERSRAVLAAAGGGDGGGSARSGGGGGGGGAPAGQSLQDVDLLSELLAIYE